MSWANLQSHWEKSIHVSSPFRKAWKEEALPPEPILAQCWHWEETACSSVSMRSPRCISKGSRSIECVKVLTCETWSPHEILSTGGLGTPNLNLFQSWNILDKFILKIMKKKTNKYRWLSEGKLVGRSSWDSWHSLTKPGLFIYLFLAWTWVIGFNCIRLNHMKMPFL